MIGQSFRIDSKVLKVTLDVIEEDKLIQGIKLLLMPLRIL